MQNTLKQCCRWQDDENHCWIEMPDSLLICKGKDACEEYEESEDIIITKGGNDK